MTSWQDLGISNPGQGRVNRRLPCPVCNKGKEDTALGVSTQSGKFHCFRCHFKGVIESNDDRPVQEAPTRIDDPKVQLRKRERLNAVWRAALPLTAHAAKPLQTYLESRGLAAAIPTLSAETVRFHPSLEYFDLGKRFGRYPAMVSIFSSAHGKPQTLHVTWLRADGTGKASVRAPRKLLPLPQGKSTGGAIRLHQDASVMGVAEGIENALTLHLMYDIPVWSARCAQALEQVRLPPYVRKILVGVDLDKNGVGEKAAEALASRLRAWRRAPEVVFVWPHGTAPRDLNDDLIEASTSEDRRRDGSP